MLNANYVKAPEYARKYGLPVSRVRRMCEAGLIDAFRDCDGGHWYIIDREDGAGVSHKDYEELKLENERLKMRLEAVYELVKEAM